MGEQERWNLPFLGSYGSIFITPIRLKKLLGPFVDSEGKPSPCVDFPIPRGSRDMVISCAFFVLTCSSPSSFPIVIKISEEVRVNLL